MKVLETRSPRQTQCWRQTVDSIFSSIRQVLRRNEPFNNLHSHLRFALLKLAATKGEYKHSDSELDKLAQEIQDGTFRFKPVFAKQITGTGTKARDVLIPPRRDKIVLRAIATLLSVVLEQRLSTFSYGRRKRGVYSALLDLSKGLDKRIEYVLRVDLANFYSTVPHPKLFALLRSQISDQLLLALIKQAVCVEVEGGSKLRVGLPTGSPISCILADFFLSCILDSFIDEYPEAEGIIVPVRYQDDLLLGFETQQDASRFSSSLKLHLKHHSLRINPAKSGAVRLNDTENPITFLGFHLFRTSATTTGFTLSFITPPDVLLSSINSGKSRILNCPKEQRAELRKQLINGFKGSRNFPGNKEAILQYEYEIQTYLYNSID